MPTLFECLCRTLACAIALGGCTFSDGEGFATLEEARLAVNWEPGEARDLGNETVLTDLGHQVALASFTLDLEELRLEQRTGGGAQASFDPADPPAGYSSCHGGHCHADDGRLVSYEEIEAELAGGAPSFVPVAELVVDRELAVLDDPRLRLGEVVPSEELPRVTLARAALVVRSLSIQASVTGGTLAAAVPLEVSISTLGAFSQRLDYVIDRDAPERLVLSAELTVDGTLFDGVDFDALATSDTITLGDPDDPSTLRVATNVLASQFSARLIEPD